MERAFINRYVVVIETDRPHAKKAGKVHYDYEAMSTKRQAQQKVDLLMQQNRGRKGKRIYIVDQEKQPNHVFTENKWAIPITCHFGSNCGALSEKGTGGWFVAQTRIMVR